MRKNPYPWVCQHCGAKIYGVIKPVKCPACGKQWPKENPKIHPKKHDWAWIGIDKNYEYSQCQWPSCKQIRRINLKTRKSEKIKLSDIPKSSLANPLSAVETRFSLRRIKELMGWAEGYDRMGKKEIAKQCRRQAEGIHEILQVHGARSEMKKYHPVFGNPTDGYRGGNPMKRKNTITSRTATTTSPFTIYNPRKKSKRSMPTGEYYADYDKHTGLWCVFHTDRLPGHAHSSWASKEQATEDASKMNRETLLRWRGYNPTRRKSVIYAERPSRYTELKPLGVMALAGGFAILMAWAFRRKT